LQRLASCNLKLEKTIQKVNFSASQKQQLLFCNSWPKQQPATALNRSPTWWKEGGEIIHGAGPPGGGRPRRGGLKEKGGLLQVGDTDVVTNTKEDMLR
jgi:hypothetical protein